MAIAFESESRSADSATCNVPSGTASGDLLVAVAASGSSSDSQTPPSGWTKVDSHSGDFFSLVGVYYIFVSGTPPASYTWTGFTSDFGEIKIQRFSGADSYGGYAAQANGPDATTNIAPTVTPDEDGCLVVWLGGSLYNGTPGLPSGYSNQYTGGGSLNSTMMCSFVQGTAAATGSASSTGWLLFSGTYTHWAANMWFRPAGGGGGSTIRTLSLLGVG